MESQPITYETYDLNIEIMFKQTNGSINRSKPPFRKYCNNCLKSNHSVPIVFENKEKMKKENGILLILDENCL